MNAPFVQGSPTSEAAAESIKPDLQRLEKMVRDAIHAAGKDGMTCDEVEVKLNLSHQTASARCTTLKRSGEIEDCGKRRATRSGRAAAVYISRYFSINSVP